MKRINYLLLISSLFLTTISHAESSINEPKINASEQCNHPYQDILSKPLVVRDAATNIDKDAVQEIDRMRQLADEYIMHRDISDFLSYKDFDKYDTEEQKRQAFKESNEIMMQSDAIEVVRFLALSYYYGDSVPKDDYQAITYLRKYLDYYRDVAPEQAENIIMGTLLYFGNAPAETSSNDNDSTSESYGTEAAFNLLVAAGSLEAEAMLISEFHSNDPACQQDILPRMTELAEQGSRIAIHQLADTYYNYQAVEESQPVEDDMPVSEQIAHTASAASHTYNEFDNPSEYWHKKAEDYPLAPYKSGF